MSLSPPTNLRAREEAFVGRREDLAKLREGMERHRLVTIVGPAGVGKTTLATRAALEALDHFTGGAWICDLTEASRLEDVCRGLGTVLDVPFLPGQGAAETVLQLGHALASRGRVLVLLDNFEQLVEHAAETIGRWLSIAQEAHLLVTSRERLHIADETLLELVPLRTPPDGDEAVELFVERVREGTGQGTLTDADSSTIGRIVRELDGLPLAIELAAARIGVLSPSELLEQLERRFEVLTLGRRDASARQRTLWAAIDWSWNLLEPGEQTSLGHCSIFRGGFSLEAARSVVDLGAGARGPDLLDRLQGLRDKSLVRTQRVDAETRFSLLASIREYAEGRLGPEERAKAEARHAAYYARAGGQWSSGAHGLSGAACLRRLLLEQDNLLAAVHRGLARTSATSGAVPERDVTDGAHVFELLIALEPIVSMRGPLSDYLALLDRALASAAVRSASSRLLPRVHGIRGAVQRLRGRTTEARADLDEALSLARAGADRLLEGELWTELGSVEMQLYRVDEARAAFDRALALLEPLHAQRAMGIALVARGTLELNLGRPEAAREAFERALAWLGPVGDPRGAGRASSGLANALVDLRRFDDACSTYLSAIDTLRSIGDQRSEAIARGNFAATLQEQGRLDDALCHYDDAIALLRSVGYRFGESAFAGYRGSLFHEQGRIADAIQEYERALAGLREVGDRRHAGLVLCMLGTALVAQARATEAARAFDEAHGHLEPVGDQLTLVALDVHRIHLDRAEGRTDGVEERLAAARAVAPRSQEVRLALRLLEPAPAPPAALVIGPRGAWFRVPGAERTELSNHRSLRLVLLRLVDAHGSAPGEALPAAELLSAGWPGERVTEVAVGNRVRVALATLRKLGLRDWLVRRGAGWMIDPERPIVKRSN